MSPKKKKQAPQAQQLIDSLLDERTPSPHDETGSVIRFDPSRTKTKGSPHAPKTFDSSDDASAGLKLDGAPKRSEDPIARADRIAREEKKIEAQIEAKLEKKKEEKKSQPEPDFEVTRTHAGAVQVEDDSLPNFSMSHSNDRAGDGDTATAAGHEAVGAPEGEAEGTMRLDPRTQKAPSAPPSFEPKQPKAKAPAEESHIDRMTATELKTVVKMRGPSMERGPEPMRSAAPHVAGGFSSAEAALKQSESLRIAQMRITELENELERIRRENQQLANAGETLRRRTDDLISKAENLEINSKEKERIFDEEKKVFRGQLQQKEREANELRGRLEEMEGRLESNFKKIRVRERELEHRLEIVKMETATLVSTKDKMILELKRQIDQLTHENEYGKQKAQELFNQYKDKQETARRVVRALRIALTILEGEEGSGNKKSE